MHSTILYSLASAALLIQPIIAGVIPSELVERACPKQIYDPKGGLCDGDHGF